MTARYELGTAPRLGGPWPSSYPSKSPPQPPSSSLGLSLTIPRRVGKPLGAELAGIYSARLGRDWRVLYEIDDAKHVVIVLDIRHRSAAYRRR